MIQNVWKNHIMAKVKRFVEGKERFTSLHPTVFFFFTTKEGLADRVRNNEVEKRKNEFAFKLTWKKQKRLKRQLNISSV